MMRVCRKIFQTIKAKMSQSQAQSEQAQKAAEELLARRKIRSSLDLWSRFNGHIPAAHHSLLISKLEACARREIRKLAIFMPPGSAKSTYSSVLFPPWFLANFLNQVILLCSHSADLATHFGRQCRNSIELNPAVLGYRLSDDSSAADNWATAEGGGFFCAGVGGRISGRRADLGMIDDPLGSRKDAESQVVRDAQWQWYLSDFKPRLKPNAVTILIQTRFHEDDLAGRILARETGWEVIRIPLIADSDSDPLGRTKGQLLWPEWFTPEMALDAQADERTFSSLYQQNPTPESGDFFKAEWIVEYQRNELPNDLRIYVGSDHAVSLRQEADRTCIVPVGIDSHDNIWVLPDVWWKKANAKEVVDEMLNVAKRREPMTWFCENAHIEKSIGPFLYDRMQEEQCYFSLEQISSHKDKRTKAQAIQGRMAQGKVRFPAFATSWWPEAKRELLTFDAGTHDDFVDALANIGRGLTSLLRPSASRARVEEVKPLSVAWLKQSMRRQHLATISKSRGL